MENHCYLPNLYIAHTEEVQAPLKGNSPSCSCKRAAEGWLSQAGLVPADTRTCYSDAPPRSSRPDSSAQKALDALFLAAPVKGEVQPWVWLLRTVADTHQLDSVHDCICYLVRPNSQIRAQSLHPMACSHCALSQGAAGLEGSEPLLTLPWV